MRRRSSNIDNRFRARCGTPSPATSYSKRSLCSLIVCALPRATRCLFVRLAAIRAHARVFIDAAGSDDGTAMYEFAYLTIDRVKVRESMIVCAHSSKHDDAAARARRRVRRSLRNKHASTIRRGCTSRTRAAATPSARRSARSSVCAATRRGGSCTWRCSRTRSKCRLITCILALSTRPSARSRCCCVRRRNAPCALASSTRCDTCVIWTSMRAMFVRVYRASKLRTSCASVHNTYSFRARR